MKKYYPLLLILSLIFWACGGGQESSTESESSETLSEDSSTVSSETPTENEEAAKPSAIETETSKFMYWSGTNLEIVQVEIDPSTSKIMGLAYQTSANSEKNVLEITKKDEEKCTVRHPKSEKTFEVDTYWTMSGNFYYADGTSKEFIPMVEFAKANEKIIMGAMPVLGYVIYQKDGKSELWLKNPDQNCKEGERNGNVSFMCGFTNPQGQNVRMMIDQIGKNVTIWVNEEMQEFIGV